MIMIDICGTANKRFLSMPEATEKLVTSIRNCFVLYDQSLKEYMVTDIKEWVLQNRADPFNIPGLNVPLK